MIKNKLLSIVLLSLTGILSSNFEIKLLNQQNIDLVKEKAGIYDQIVLDNASSDNSALVCFLPSGEVGGFLSAYYAGSDVILDITSIRIFKMDMKKEIIIALLRNFEKRCKLLGKKNIYINCSSDDIVSQKLYMKLGYKEFSVAKKAALSILRSMFKCFMFDGSAKGVFIEQIKLYKTL